MSPHFVKGTILVNSFAFPVVNSQWSNRDVFETLKVRWSVGRMNYRVEPGIYATGTPDRNSHVFVTANYKLSFDHLRRALEGLDAWILVIDTKGVNVWCAAGKGVFSTKEVVRRIRIHHLENVVDHHKIILPQLAATGVAAHEVKKMTGFSVIYGPVRALDIRNFIETGLKATQEMRTVYFPLKERLKLIPADIFYGKYYLLIIPIIFFLLSGFSQGKYSIETTTDEGWKSIVNLFAGYLSGCMITPALLPWIPFRMFALKGFLSGLFVSLILFVTGSLGTNIIEIVSWFMIICALSSFMAMNFTGSSTFTSLSGVQKEMKICLPVQIIIAGLGLAGWILSRIYTL